jgi:hypothetical protein
MPYSFFLAFATYSFLLFFEKVAFNVQSIVPHEGHAHHHHHQEEESKVQEVERKEAGQDDSGDEEEEVFKNVVSARGQFASFMQIRECK